jgi:hypothetical protein
MTCAIAVSATKALRSAWWPPSAWRGQIQPIRDWNVYFRILMQASGRQW